MPRMPAAGVRLLLLPGLLTVALLAACQDPSGVGLNIIGEEGNDPNTIVAPADTLFLTDEAEVTGGFADGTTPVQERFLVGAVTDPTFGDVSAEAYLDVRPPNTLPEGFTDRTITSATLRLFRDYAYGDTTATLDLALFDVDADWSPAGAEADTSFAVGARVADYEVQADDSLYTLALPSSWVSANEAALRGDSVLTEFSGFHLRLADGTPGGAVVGIEAPRSRLRLTTAEDTVEYPLREVFTNIQRGDALPVSDDVVVLRDGGGEALAVTLPIEGLDDAAVARAVFRLSADPSLLEGGGLTRALPEQLVLIGVTAEGSRLLLGSAQRGTDSGLYDFSSGTFTNVIQDALIGEPLFERYLIAPLQSPVTLDVLPVVAGPAPGEGDPDRRPRLVLTVVPPAD